MRHLFIFLVGSLCALTHAWAVDPVVITVSAASSLTNAFKDMGPVFEGQYQHIKLQFNFAASGQLFQQISKGAPVDVFASADAETMDWAEEQHWLINRSRKNFASNQLVLVVSKQAKYIPSKLSELAKPDYQKIALGLPASVPAGHYAQAVLERQQLWHTLEPKLVRAQNVRQVLVYVGRGEVDAGFVYATDVMTNDKVHVAMTVPTERKILYPIALIKNSSYEKEAEQFVTFVNGPVGQAILAKHGFGKP